MGRASLICHRQFHLHMGMSYRMWESSCNITLRMSVAPLSRDVLLNLMLIFSYSSKGHDTMVNGNHSPFKLFKTNSTFSPAFQFLPLLPRIYFGGLPSYKFSVWFEFLETHDVHAMFLHNGDDFGSNSNQNLPRDFFIGTF